MFLLGRKQIFIFGLISAGLAFILLGLIHVSSNEVALILSLLSKVVLGIGLGCYMTAGPAILLNLSPNKAERVIALFEAAGGIGFLLGPILGYFINDAKIGCFYFTGIIYLTYAVFSSYFINVEEEILTLEERSLKIGILKKPKIFFEFLAQMMMLITLGYLSAVIELYLHIDFKFSEKICGLLFSVYTISYFLTSVIEPFVSKFIKNEGRIIASGILISAISFFLLSGMVISHYSIVLIGLALMGIGDALIYSNKKLVPIIARILKTCNIDYNIDKSSELIDTVSSLTLFFSNIGEILGPILGGILVKQLGYNTSFLIMSFISLTFFILYSLLTNVFNSFPYQLEQNQNDVEFMNLSQTTEKKKPVHLKTEN